MIERPSRREVTSPGMRKLLEMERQVRPGHADRLGQHSGRHAIGAGGDELAHDAQAVLLTEGREGGDGLPFVHHDVNISTIVET